jgi:hypothetical protein
VRGRVLQVLQQEVSVMKSQGILVLAAERLNLVVELERALVVELQV